MMTKEDIFTFASEKNVPVDKSELTDQNESRQFSTKNLRLLISEVIKEEFFNRMDTPLGGKKKGMGLIQRVKSFLTGNTKADEFAYDWIDDQELYNSIELPDELKDSVKKFIRANYDRVAERTQGNERKLDRVLSKALDRKFRREIARLAAEADADLMDDDDDYRY